MQQIELNLESELTLKKKRNEYILAERKRSNVRNLKDLEERTELKEKCFVDMITALNKDNIASIATDVKAIKVRLLLKRHNKVLLLITLFIPINLFLD